MKILPHLFAILISLPAFGEAPSLNIENHAQGMWSLPSANNELRWLVIHNLQDGNRSGIFHIEVLSRVKGDPVWKLEHEVPHMAITKEALTRSVSKPLMKGAVYPEMYDAAFENWQKQRGGLGGAVCETSVEKCLPHPAQ